MEPSGIGAGSSSGRSGTAGTGKKFLGSLGWEEDDVERRGLVELNHAPMALSLAVAVGGEERGAVALPGRVALK
ncbi:hypothetical protein GCM10022245_14410 [Streptomyces mayteni]